jgi:hypothetical protein
VSLPIEQTSERISGGVMFVPPVVGALIANLAPGTSKLFGSFTGALFGGALPILAVFYVCMGAAITFRCRALLVAAMNDTDGGPYMALMTQHGRPNDAAAFSVHRLAQAVAGIVRDIHVDRLLLEGGATAVAVIRELGWSRLRACEPCVSDVCALVPTMHRGTVLCIKPGSYPSPASIWPTPASARQGIPRSFVTPEHAS